MDAPSTPPTPSSLTPTPVKPTVINNKHPQHHRGFSVWRMGIGLLVVLLGLQLLAMNYGWDWAVNFDLGRLWPAIIILIGISMLSKGHAINRIVGMVLTLAVIAMVAILMTAKPAATNREDIHRDISVDKEATATSAYVALDMGAASVAVSGGSDQAASGTFTSTVADLSTESRLDGTVQRINLMSNRRENTGWSWFWKMRNTIDLKLNHQWPIDLNIDSGAASLDLDLRTLMAKNLTVDAGASSIELKLGDLVDSNTTVIKSGASSIDVDIPKTVDGIKLKIDAGLSSKNVPSAFKDRGDGLYETDGYVDAKKKVDLTIDAGASSIDVSWN